MFHKIDYWGARTKICRKKIPIAPLFIAILISSTLAVPVLAKPKLQERVDFHSVVKGSGIMYWGAAFLPTVQWGTVEYSGTCADSEMNLAGTSDAQEVSAAYPVVKMLGLTNIQLSKMELTVTWTHDATTYELRLKFLSTIETDGLFGEAWWNTQGNPNVYDTLGDAFYLGVNMGYAADDSEMLNPQHATMQFVGTYKAGSSEQAISGNAWIAIIEFFGEGLYGKAVSLYLWINGLDTYATLSWGSKELVAYATGWEQVPSAQVINIYVKAKK